MPAGAWRPALAWNAAVLVATVAVAGLAVRAFDAATLPLPGLALDCVRSNED